VIERRATRRRPSTLSRGQRPLHDGDGGNRVGARHLPRERSVRRLEFVERAHKILADRPAIHFNDKQARTSTSWSRCLTKRSPNCWRRPAGGSNAASLRRRTRRRVRRAAAEAESRGILARRRDSAGPPFDLCAQGSRKACPVRARAPATPSADDRAARWLSTTFRAGVRVLASESGERPGRADGSAVG
jgi:hypothetical protein